MQNKYLMFDESGRESHQVFQNILLQRIQYYVFSIAYEGAATFELFHKRFSPNGELEGRFRPDGTCL